MTFLPYISNDEIGDEFVLMSLRRERDEREEQFRCIVERSEQVDGWRSFHEFDYTPRFRRWLVNNALARGWTILEDRDPGEFCVKVRMEKR